jgi:Polyketide cyclase / dehydrase and lipid transport
MLKKILIALALLILGFAVVVALQPSDFSVERSATVAAPQADVFAQVNDLHKWDAWSPWAKLDPEAKIGFEGPESGQGAAMTWSGNDKVGEGKMTVVESKPNDAVKLKVDFVKPFEGTSNSEFGFKPDGDQTAVTWTMSGHHNFLEKAFCLVMNGKKMIGDDMEKGLARLKSVAETGNSASN